MTKPLVKFFTLGSLIFVTFFLTCNAAHQYETEKLESCVKIFQATCNANVVRMQHEKMQMRNNKGAQTNHAQNKKRMVTWPVNRWTNAREIKQASQ